MHATARCSARVALIVSIGAAMSACGSVDLSGRAMVETLKPYRATVVQGQLCLARAGAGFAARYEPPAGA